MHCYCFMVVVVCGVICGCVSQNNDDCNRATGRPDFKVFGDSCFWVSTPADKRSRNVAKDICRTFKGHLATVARNETLDFLKNNWNIENPNNEYWIGLYTAETLTEEDLYRRRQANWKWLDGTMYNQNSIEWHSGYPGKRETLGCLRYLKWKAYNAGTETTLPFICETKLKGSTTQSSQETASIKMSRPSYGTQTEDCGQDWVYNETTRLCYLPALTSNLDWNAAKDWCEQMNAHLATPSTQEQHQAVVDLLSKKELRTQNVWIGLRHEYGASGSNPQLGWTWLDNASYDFMAWAGGEPQATEKYVRIKDGLWLGKGNGTFNHTLCQKGPIEAQIPQTPQPSRASDTVTSSTQKSPNVVATNTGLKGTLGGNKMSQRSTTDILGPVLGAAFVAILVALIIGVILLRRRRSTQLESLVRRLKIPHLSKKAKDNTTTGADTSYSIVENTSVTPLAVTPKSTVFISEQEKPVAKFDKPRVVAVKPLPEIPINEYATVPAKKTAKPKLYATVKAYLTAPKPSIRRASSLEGLDTGSDLAYENTVISTIVRVEELNDWVKEAIASGLIEKQYKSIPTSDPTQSKEYCNQEHLKPKNRYRNIVPYDNNRVELSALPNDPHSHYINASYIDSYKQKKTFIAAQGPTVNTVNDFWRMIWEKSIKTVVMVSNQFEAETAKMNFVRYWPKGKEKEPFGDISVAIKKVENLPDYIVRHMSVSKGSDIKIVKQFQFKSWPDHGVPKHAMALINFREKIRKEMSKGKEPVLVHCSAGVGRTGTIIAIDYLLQQATKEGVVDFVTCLRKLRKQRTDMVQRLTQYQFIIRAVLEALTLGQTAIACSLYAQTVQTFQDPLTDGDTRMQKQFEMLVHYFTEEKSSEVAAAAELPENIKKNRDPKVLPASSKRVLLMTPVSGKNDYINAVFVDGHRRKSAYIATHAPLQHTIIDFWRAVFDYNSTVIVMLCPKYYLKTDEVYFPEGLGEKFDCTPFEIECLEEDDHNGVRRTQLSLKYCGLERHLVHFSLTEDLSGMSLDEKMATIHSIYENAKKWQQQQTEKNAPITVHCLEGTEWTGLYCILSNLFDQINEEQEVDVFHAVGQSRLARREFISTMKEYEMVYDIIALYIDQFNMYSNFL